jgi:guanylate kinase
MEEAFIIFGILKEGVTAVFIGSSGVGKSTIINSLFKKDVLKTLELSRSVKKRKAYNYQERNADDSRRRNCN